MKRLFSIILFAAALSYSAVAQELGTTFFLDNNVYSYRINPAIPGEKGFVGFAISNLNATLGSNMGINSLIYKNPNGTGLVTGFNKAIPSSEFLGNLHDISSLSESLNENLLAIGFWTKKSFHSIELNLHESADINIPKDLFAMLKNGSRAEPYMLSNTGASAAAYAELAYGYSRRINDKFSVGGRLKLLVGLANAEAVFSDASLTLNGNEINYNVNADLKLAGNFLNVASKASEYVPGKQVIDYSNIQLGSFSPNGFGAAVDLGVTYRPIKHLELSFSVLDLGGINWSYNLVGKSSGYDRFDGVLLKANGDVEQELDEALKRLQRMIEFEHVASTSGFSMLHCALNLGARYRMPFYERLSVGALLSGKINRLNPYVDFRVGATITPIDWFSLTGNYGINTYSTTFGFAASLNLANINFILGYEGYSGKVLPFQISEFSAVAPLRPFNYVAKFGVNITFGKRHNDFSTAFKLFRKKAKE